MSVGARSLAAIDRWLAERTDGAGDPRQARASELAKDDRWVLLGEPGSGKSATLRQLAEAAGTSVVTARALVEGHRPLGRIAFVDAFEEYRIGEPARDRLADVAAALADSGYAGWRIACRSISLPPQEVRFLAGRLGSFAVWQLESMDVRDIHALLTHLGVSDPPGFVKGFDRIAAASLLGNPTMLILLKNIVAAGSVCVETRGELLAAATWQMAHELGEDMPEDPRRPLPSAVLHAAETACLVLLLTGRNDLWALNRPPAVPAGTYVTLDDFVPAGVSTDALRYALDTPMFRGEGGAFTPAHRIIAEFLGGRALARATAPEDQMSAALPVRRAMAILCGDGSRPAPALTGLHAWFVTFLAATRHHAIAMDLLKAEPEGVLFHGDPAALPFEQRRELLQTFGLKDPWFLSASRGSTALAGLAGEDLTEELGAVVLDAAESYQRRAAVLTALATGRRVTALAGRLEGLATDPDTPEGLRRLAIDACVHLAVDPAVARRRVLATISREAAGGPLMLRLHLLPPLVGRGAGVYEVRQALVDYAASGDGVMGYARHLGDALVAAPMPGLFDEPFIDLQRTGARNIELARVLDAALAAAVASTTDLSAERLLRWIRNHQGSPFLKVRQATRDAVGAWTARGDFLELALFDEIVRTAPPAWRNGILADFQRVTGQPLSAGSRRVMVERLEALSASPLSEELKTAATVACTLTWKHHDLGDLPARVMAAVTARQAELEAHVPWFFAPDRDEGQEEWEREWQVAEAERRAELIAVRARDRDWFGGNRMLVRSGRHVAPLAYGAQIALHEHDDELELRSDDPLSEWCGADTAADVRIGWETFMSDFPVTPATLGRMAARSETSPADWVAVAHAAGDRAAQPGGGMSPPHALALLCGCFLVRDSGRREALETAAIDRILLHADGRDALVEFWSAAMRSRCRELPELSILESRGRQLAPVLDRVLRCRPAARKQVLRRAIEAALRCMPGLDVVAAAQAMRSCAQRPHARRLWIMAAFLVQPEGRRDDFVRELSDPDGHATFESLYAVARREKVAATVEAEVERDALVIRHLGPVYPPPASFGQGPALGQQIGEAIDAVSRSPLVEAAAWLRILSEETSLKAWHETLRHAAAVQEKVRLEAAFTAPLPAAMARALACGPPAVAADSRAVVVEVLLELAREIRDGPTSAWRLFWNRPVAVLPTPRIENECRDLLADRLSDRLLPFRIPVTSPVATEARSGEDRRVDMVVLGRGAAALPIEVKRHWNADLWTAPAGQLLPYVRSLGTSGHGIYLVLWFGAQEPVPTIPPGLGPIGSPEDLRDALVRHLAVSETGRLEVLVIDVSDRETVTAAKRRGRKPGAGTATTGNDQAAGRSLGS